MTRRRRRSHPSGSCRGCAAASGGRTSTPPRRARPSACRRRTRRTAPSRSRSTRPRAAAASGAVWIDEPGAGIALSVVLQPPPPVARWPELTLVAAEAVAGAIGPGGVDQAPERRPRRRAGRWPASSPRRASASCSGSASTSAARRGRAPAAVERDRLELLVDDPRAARGGLRRVAGPAHGPLSAALALPAASRALTLNDVTGAACPRQREHARGLGRTPASGR